MPYPLVRPGRGPVCRCWPVVPAPPSPLHCSPLSPLRAVVPGEHTLGVSNLRNLLKARCPKSGCQRRAQFLWNVRGGPGGGPPSRPLEGLAGWMSCACDRSHSHLCPCHCTVCRMVFSVRLGPDVPLPMEPLHRGPPVRPQIDEMTSAMPPFADKSMFTCPRD